MTHPVAANQRFYTVLVQASVHIYKATGKMRPLLRPHIYLLTFLFFSFFLHSWEWFRRFIWIIDMVNVGNCRGKKWQMRMSDEAELAGIHWARSKRREALACSLEGLLNIASQRTEVRLSALKLPVTHLEASSSLSSQENLLSSLKYITAHAQVKWEREILLSPLTGVNAHY